MKEKEQGIINMDNWEEIFYYENGKLYWKVSPNSRIKVGSEAGGVKGNGYRQVKFKGNYYQVHRIIYEMHYGCIPDGMQIDHINRVKADNSLNNLRIVTVQGNSFNQKAKGYFFDKVRCKYRAQITLDGKQTYLGLYNTKEEARKSYLKAKDGLHSIKDR
jgi:hypothetical protein